MVYVCNQTAKVYICNMIERIKLLLSVKNLSPAQLALEIGVQRSGISHILSGRNKPSLDFIMKILESYPEINESWLLMGNGEMLKNKSESSTLFHEEEKKEEALLIEKEIVIKEEPTIAPRTIEEEVVEPYKQKTVKPNDLSLEKTPNESNDKLGNSEGLKQELLGALIQQEQSKKIVQIIAIYDDDSFKIFHSK